MAAKTRRRRAETKPLGKESWQIQDAGGNMLYETPWGEGTALTRAQRLAEEAPKPDTFLVLWQGLFGSPELLYRVLRDEDGIVWTKPA